MFFNPATLTPPATFATLRLSENCATAEIRKVAELADPLAAGKVAEVAEVAEGIAAKNDSGATAKVAESQKSQTLAAEKSCTPYASAEQLADTRRTCRQCRNLERNGRCLAAGRGELPLTNPRYEPDPERLERCIGYLPTAEDADQRPGRERYPSLYRRLWATQEQGR